MLHDQHRIPEVTESNQRGDEASVITLMEADGWLVKDVENANEARTNLCCQANALCLAPRKRCCRAIHGQIVEANVNEESGTLADLLDDRLRNRSLSLPEGLWQCVDPRHQLADRHRGHLGDVASIDADREDFGL